MKNFKRVISVVLVIVLCLSLSLLVACGDSGDSGEKTYTVNVKDALGNPYTSGIVVKFLQDGEQIAMQVCDEKGVASKKLPSGDYSVSLNFTDSKADYYFKTDGLKLTSSKNELDVILSYKITSKPETLVDEFEAYSVNVGCTYVELKSGSRNYFLFSPTTAGNYEFSIPVGDNVTIGYYGAPHFVQSESAKEVKDNKFSISVKASMIGTGDSGTNTFVIGIDADKDANNCILGIERIGDPIKTVEDEPWTVYKKTVDIQAYTLPATAEIKEFDLTASTDNYKIVLNKDDGFYHLNDKNGPLVLVRLAEDSEYIDSFQKMVDKSAVVKYFYDDDKFVKKETYNECLAEYIECVDEDEGVYPLTEDLKYIIQQRGEYVGWWDDESSGYRFKDMAGNIIPGINDEIAWLLMCCYIE